jgi:AAA+ superfamily predicted ATPase
MKVEIKLDKTTLPADGQKVRWETYEEEGFVGVYLAEEEMFFESESVWRYAFEVTEWEPIED